MTRLIWTVQDTSNTNAGISIRINPIINSLRANGIDVTVATYDDVIASLLSGSERAEKSTYIFSKPHKSEYLSSMLALQSSGARVGIDIFDNYYAETEALREYGVQSVWRNILQQADFCVFSTAYLRDYAHSLISDQKYSFIIGDPVYPDSYESSKCKSASKWDQFFHSLDYIHVSWFGIDSNPYFYAGLSDLYFDISRLRDFLGYPSCLLNRRISHKVSICTKDVSNSRRLVTELNRIGIHAEFVPWTRHTCTQLLEESHAVFLPTNNSHFSLSKTHNRLVEALSNNCLVYVSPNSLYTQFKSSMCIDSYSEFASLLQSSKSSADIAQRSREALECISTLIKANDDSVRFCNYLMQDRLDIYSSRNTRVSLVGSIKDADNIKILRKAGAIIAGLISPLIKSPPSYDHIELIHADSSVLFRYHPERISASLGISGPLQLSDTYHCQLRLLANTSLEFKHISPAKSPYSELKLVDSGEAFRQLLVTNAKENIDKSLTYRYSPTRLLIYSLYECLYQFCYSYFDLDCPVIVSGSSPIGSFLDELSMGVSD